MAGEAPTIYDEEYVHISMYLPEKISKCINVLAEDHLKDTSMKSYYVPYILNIGNFDGISQKELKKLIPFDKSRISVVVHELMNKRLVYDDGIGRNSSLHLTEEGNSAIPVCKEFHDVVKKEIFNIDSIMEEEIKVLLLDLNKRIDGILAEHE